MAPSLNPCAVGGIPTLCEREREGEQRGVCLCNAVTVERERNRIPFYFYVQPVVPAFGEKDFLR